MPVGWMKKLEDSRRGKIRHYLPSLAGDANLRPEELPLHSINSRRNFLATCGRRKELKKKKTIKQRTISMDRIHLELVMLNIVSSRWGGVWNYCINVLVKKLSCLIYRSRL